MPRRRRSFCKVASASVRLEFALAQWKVRGRPLFFLVGERLLLYGDASAA